MRKTRSADDPLERGSREHYDDAVYYDHAYRRRREDIDFYVRLARQHGGPVLELGAGSGRVSVELAALGLDVTALDHSAAMIERGRARCEALTAGRVTFVEGDLRRFSLGATFPLIVAPFNVLQHLYDPEDFHACFTRVREHLSPGGRFVFDVRVPQARELARDPDHAYAAGRFIHPTRKVKVRYTESFAYDPIRQVQYVTMRFEPEGRARPFEALLTHRQIFPAELDALVRWSGLTASRRWGGFDGRALSPDADEMIWELTR